MPPDVPSYKDRLKGVKGLKWAGMADGAGIQQQGLPPIAGLLAPLAPSPQCLKCQIMTAHSIPSNNLICRTACMCGCNTLSGLSGG